VIVAAIFVYRGAGLYGLLSYSCLILIAFWSRLGGTCYNAGLVSRFESKTFLGECEKWIFGICSGDANGSKGMTSEEIIGDRVPALLKWEHSQTSGPIFVYCNGHRERILYVPGVRVTFSRDGSTTTYHVESVGRN